MAEDGLPLFGDIFIGIAVGVSVGVINQRPDPLSFINQRPDPLSFLAVERESADCRLAFKTDNNA